MRWATRVAHVACPFGLPMWPAPCPVWRGSSAPPCAALGSGEPGGWGPPAVALRPMLLRRLDSTLWVPCVGRVSSSTLLSLWLVPSVDNPRAPFERKSGERNHMCSGPSGHRNWVTQNPGFLGPAGLKSKAQHPGKCPPVLSLPAARPPRLRPVGLNLPCPLRAPRSHQEQPSGPGREPWRRRPPMGPLPSDAGECLESPCIPGTLGQMASTAIITEIAGGGRRAGPSGSWPGSPRPRAPVITRHVSGRQSKPDLREQSAVRPLTCRRRSRGPDSTGTSHGVVQPQGKAGTRSLCSQATRPSRQGRTAGQHHGERGARVTAQPGARCCPGTRPAAVPAAPSGVRPSCPSPGRSHSAAHRPAQGRPGLGKACPWPRRRPWCQSRGWSRLGGLWAAVRPGSEEASQDGGAAKGLLRGDRGCGDSGDGHSRVGGGETLTPNSASCRGCSRH